MIKIYKRRILVFFTCFLSVIINISLNSCAGTAASAQEYYSIGMAYFDMGRFDEAEKWLNRARAADRTKVASEYNLGRIAFETNRFYEAAGYFEGILKKDPDNVLALKAAAYTRIKTGELELAEKHYSKLLSLVPESSDDGYNHALVLFAMERYGEAEEVLIRYEYTLLDNSANLLLYARCLKELDRVESIDYYANYLADNKDPKVRYEYAQILVQHELFARALEEYRLCLEEAADAAEPKKSDIHFALAELLLIADSESEEGITELETAVELGFSDIEAVEELQSNANLSTANRDKIRNIVNEMQRILERAKEQEKALEQESSLETEPEAGSDGTGE